MRTITRGFRYLVMALAVFVSPAWAALDLELTQGVDGAIPIAIVAFDHELQSHQALSTAIKNDLRNSGHFRFVKVGGLKGKPVHHASIDVAKWRKLGADYLILGALIEKSSGQYQVQFQLVSLYDNQQRSSGALLLNKSFTVGKNNTRGLAHHISDLIYEKLLGKPGFFSTHIAYVLVKKHKKKPNVFQLMVADIDGHNPQALVTSKEPIMSPAWSPDGKRIAYVSFEGHKAAVFMQTVLTGQRVKLTDFEGINGAPSWSPDGQTLAVVLSKTGYPKIYTFDVKTKSLRQVTRGWAIDTEPSFSPDGQSLIFTSNRGGGPQIYRVPVSGGPAERLTFDGRYNATASYTKDGKALVLLHKDDRHFTIAMQDLISGRMDILTDTGHNQSPSLAPNDEMVVFATKFGKKQVLGMVSRDARIRLRLPAQEGDVREPAWSPN